MGWRTFGFAILFAAAVAGAAGEASACLYNPVVRIPRPTRTELEAERLRAERDLLRLRRGLAAADLARGVDPAGELARMLVPNIRPVPIHNSDCGPINEIDLGDGEETAADWLAGTYLAAHAGEFPAVTRRFDGETLGPACNAEFRERFAAILRRRLDGRQLRAAYLFLAARQGITDVPIRRLVAFETGARRPPVRWTARHRPSILRWQRLTGEGRALTRTMDDFWRESASLLDPPARACPAATARWTATQARLVAAIEARYPRARRLREREAARR